MKLRTHQLQSLCSSFHVVREKIGHRLRDRGDVLISSSTNRCLTRSLKYRWGFKFYWRFLNILPKNEYGQNSRNIVETHRPTCSNNNAASHLPDQKSNRSTRYKRKRACIDLLVHENWRQQLHHVSRRRHHHRFQCST